ncbi:MAG: transposase, partial [Acidobacteria bacterium]|nr:transposase [Acidobacteriota bacterium]
MARPLRLEHEGALWHITSRGNERKNIYRSDADRRLFLSLLGEAVKRYRWILHEYMLMSNHYHLLIETPEKTLSRGMQWLNGEYARGFNKRHKRVGHLFHGRFKGQLVEKDSYLLELIRYVALNPVRAGIVARPEEYRWSSYR